MASCTDEVVKSDINNDPAQETTTTVSNLQSAKLAVVNSSQSRVKIAPTPRTPQPGQLSLYAEIANPSSEISGFVKEGRNMSATCVFYDKDSKTFYTTYHMQGNNYNTTQDVETKGFIEAFTITPNTEEGGNPYTLDLKNLYTSGDANIDFDFNHLYFDDLSNWLDCGSYKGSDSGVRFIAVGHSSQPVKTGTGYNTKAIIAKLDLQNKRIDYSTVLTGDKITDENVTNHDGSLTSLGDEDAADVNCVIRKYDWYYLATRKGVAVLNARLENLFTPIPNYNYDPANYQVYENTVYFVKTPGSAKHFCHIPGNGSHFSLLYLTQDTPAGFDQNTSSPANIVQFSMNAGDGTMCGSSTVDSSTTGKSIDNTQGFDLTQWSLNVNQHTVDGLVTPVDGKNVLAQPTLGRQYACLGKGGLYVRKDGVSMDGPYTTEETIIFTDAKDGSGSRPVNGVFVEDIEQTNNGFVYVANGACLTILDGGSLEKVAEFSAFEEGKEVSANYVHVVKTDDSTNGSTQDRLVTVAYGQDGVRVFRFVPPILW